MMILPDPKKREKHPVCALCGRDYFPTVGFSVIDHNPPRQPDGSILLVVYYKDMQACKQCLEPIKDALEKERREEQEKLPWITWEEKGRVFAYHQKKDFTWELLESGRPKKLSEKLLPPWDRYKSFK